MWPTATRSAASPSPKLGVSFVVVDGTDTGDLRKGPGFYPGSPLPGAPGTVAIAGHRTTYLAPFRHVDRLRKGDAIRIEMPYGEFDYAVTHTRVVAPSDTGILANTGKNTIVLTACTPLYTAKQRIAVFGRLVREIPKGPAQDGSRTLVDQSSGLD